jgi:UDP-N-acetylglucosamine acyltransferase
MNTIHPTAIVHHSTVLGDDNYIGPYVVIGPRVKIGSNNWLGPYSSFGLAGDIFGQPTNPIDITPVDEAFGIQIGDSNIFKESVSVHSGSKSWTKIGSHCYIMPKSHLGHDCILGNNITLSPGVLVAGHVIICSNATLGIGSIVHQKSIIGPGVMVGMGTKVRGIVEPFMKVLGENAQPVKINSPALLKLGFTTQDIKDLKEIFRQGWNPDLFEAFPIIQKLLIEFDISLSLDK